jgi:hypothetical protein
MVRKLVIASILLILFTSTATAGFYSSGYSRQEGTVIAAVQIKEKGLYNLVVTIDFLRKPQRGKIYKSDEYEKLVNKMLVKSRGIALQKILESQELALRDFAGLKKNIETDISNLAAKLKKSMLPNQDVEVVFSISDFYLLEPKDK